MYLTVLELLPCKAFLICRKLAVLSCVSHNFCGADDKISDPDGVELDCANKKPCNFIFIECLLDEDITSRRG